MELVAPEPTADSELLESDPQRIVVLRLDGLDGQLRFGDRGEPDQAADLDVVGADPPATAAQVLHPLDRQHVGADPLDPGS